ncbi:hypothetical protein ABH922_005374 [Rhodococcus sp. 27YEA15]|uniref:DUF2637 domain-containing protein n=1 Tax=Rhodococcus sp. 27YEA15 TaxID=3156259 RepID=UPI003C7B4A3A
MDNFSLRAARIQLGALLASLVLAILIALGITAGAFVLSFAVQRDLARQAMIPESLAWIFPVMVDSAILGSTIAIVLLGKLTVKRWDTRFFISLAISVVTISILGNAYHAFHAARAATTMAADGWEVGFTPLTPAIAALIAVIPPALVLAFTHAITILVRATGVAYSDYRMQINESSSVGDGIAVDLFANLAVEDTSAGASNDLSVDGGIEVDDLPKRARQVFGSESGVCDDLFEFIAASDLHDSVKDTARRKLSDPSLTWESIAQSSFPPVATSTAWRRYEKFDAAARAAGFESPPLPDLRVAEHSDVGGLVTVS